MKKLLTWVVFLFAFSVSLWGATDWQKLVKVGDEVLYSKYGGTEVKLEGKEYMILSQDDILAVVE